MMNDVYEFLKKELLMINKSYSSTETIGNLKSLSQASHSVELIQQWQYIGNVHPKLLENTAFENAKKAGLTSVQSYVLWAEIEKEPGKFDFSSYDVLVEKLSQHGLKWVPFLILGPYYATPKWFQESNESVYARCVEHSKDSKIQSLWNPHLPKYVDRFISIFAGHYNDINIFESILLGISGNWGEAIYPSTGCFYGGFHTHPGWWCGDVYATLRFRQWAMEKYESLDLLNANWNTNFRKVEEIIFPTIKQPLKQKISYPIFNVIPYWMKPRLRPIWRVTKFAWNNGVAPYINRFRLLLSRSKDMVTHQDRQRWLDFVEWYQTSMTKWAEFWLKTARKYFPEEEIYLVTGGYGEPASGADFSVQTKIASKYNAGIRITNQNDSYSESFAFTRLVSSASRFYGTHFTTEEAGINQPYGVTMRIFDAVTSGAKGAYFKSIIGMGSDFCTGRSFSIGELTQGAINLNNNLQHFVLIQPIVEVVFLFPNSSIIITPTTLNTIYSKLPILRDLIDFDLIDENMIANGALWKYRFLIISDGNWLRAQTLAEIRNWVRNGGILIYNKYLHISGNDDTTKDICKLLFSRTEVPQKIDTGYTLSFNAKGQRLSEFISRAIYNNDKMYPWRGIPEIDGKRDGVYATRFLDKIMYYNSTNFEIRKTIIINNTPQKRVFELMIKPKSITSVSLGRT